MKCEILDDINRNLKEVTSRLDEMNSRFTSQIDDVINRIDRIEEIQNHTSIHYNAVTPCTRLELIYV